MLAAFNRFMKGLMDYLGQWWRFFGRILIAIGSVIAGYGNGHYHVVSRTIENCFRSVLIQMKVTRVINTEPLYVTFVTSVKSSYWNKIDWTYFHSELMLLLGCGFCDISRTCVSTSADESIHHINITRTALNNLEMGRAEESPDLFEERDTEYRLKRALELAKTIDLTPEILEKELGITSYHAKLMYSQITKSDALPIKPKGKLVN